MKHLKIFILFSLSIIFFLSSYAYAGGDNVGNGGDPCENRFQLVRNDIRSWVEQGGGNGLNLPKNTPVTAYNSLILKYIQDAVISCTDSNIKVGQSEKTCRNFFDVKNSPVIVCNRSRFLQSTEDEQYVLVHHEFMGLAGIETNNNEASDYSISNQISSYLENQIVKKLKVKLADPHQLQLYDISILLPTIQGPESLHSFALQPQDIGGFGQLVPDEFYKMIDPFYTTLNAAKEAFGSNNDGLNFIGNKESFSSHGFYNSMEAMALRIVPCTANLVAQDKNCQHQIRIVWQVAPWRYGSSSADRLYQEAAVHATYSIPEADLISLVQKLKNLKASVEVPEASENLWVNPYLEQRRLGSPYAKELFAIFKSFIGEKRLVQLTTSRFGWDMYVTEGIWYFSGINISNGKAEAIVIPRVNTKIQSYASTRAEQGSFWGLMKPVPAELKPFNLTWREIADIEKMSEDQLMAGGRAAQRMQNPKFHNGKNTDCVSCHVAQSTREWFKNNVAWINLNKKFPEDEYKNINLALDNITPPFDNKNGGAATVRQFGYVGKNPFVSQRVINETADALEFITNSKW